MRVTHSLTEVSDATPADLMAHATRQRHYPARAALSWWWRKTAPPGAAPDATFAEKELARRGHVGSALLLGLTALALVALLAFLGLAGSGAAHVNAMAPFGCLLALAVCAAALLLNRRGHVTAAGLVLTAATDAALGCALLASAGSPTPHAAQLVPLLAQAFVLSELAAVAFFAPWGTLPVALLNSALLAAACLLSPSSASAATPALGELLVAVAVQMTLAAVLALVMTSTAAARREAERAALVAEAEWRFAAEQSLALHEDAQHLSGTLETHAAGEYAARVPALETASMARVGARLNQLFDWFQRFSDVRFQMIQVEDDAHRLVDALNTLRAGRDPVWPEASGTPLDAVFEALRGATAWAEDEPMPMPAPVTPAALAQVPEDVTGASVPDSTAADRIKTEYENGRRDFHGVRLIGASLSDVDLPEINLSDANLIGAGLDDADLTSADLSGAILIRADLSGAHLAGAVLARATLHGARLVTADLSGADCDGANLGDADLSGANLHNTILTGASLDEADLSKADLHGADLSEASLRRARVSGAAMVAAKLHGARLEGAKLTAATLTMADLHGANLRDADLHSADLSEADLSEADLSGADVSDARLDGADLRYADLRGADLRGAHLDGANLTGALLDGALLDTPNQSSGSRSGAGSA